ncbi:MAG: hypothetical protein Q8R28_07995 [Dehalococcoidia bacterium]|nr:hypothetical protein [Dehalococcoidia bacterium]
MPPAPVGIDPGVIFVIGAVGAGLYVAGFILYQWGVEQGESLPYSPLPQFPRPPILRFDGNGAPILPG